MKIFISYRREDSAGHAGRLYDALQAHFGRENVFMDLSGIDSGQDFVDAIDTAVRSCDALVAVVGNNWLTCGGVGGRRLDDPRDFVRSEIAAALERGIPVVPVLVEGTTMPSAGALPDALKPLATRHAHELSDRRWSYDIGRLIVAIEKLGGKPRGWERRTWFSLAAALAFIAILGAVFSYRMLQERDADLANDSAAERDARARLDELAPLAPVPERAGDSRGSPTGSGSRTPTRGVDLAGEWSAEVTYSWGATHTERFTFKLDGNEILGTASFLGTRRGILSGTLNGDKVQFHTRTQEVLGDWNNPKDVVHRYRAPRGGRDVRGFVWSTEPEPHLLDRSKCRPRI